MNGGPQKHEGQDDVVEVDIPHANSSHSSPGPIHLIVIQDKSNHYPAIENLISHFVSNSTHNVSQVTMENLQPSSGTYNRMDICIEVYEGFENHLEKLVSFMTGNGSYMASIPNIAFHIHYEPYSDWSEINESRRSIIMSAIDTLRSVAGPNVVHASIIHKYNSSTVFITERDQLQELGHQIQNDFLQFPKLHTLDYRENGLRFFPGVKFPLSLQTLNIGGGASLETLSGFKLPPSLKTLTVGSGSMTNIDNISFPSTLENLTVIENKIYFLEYVDFPPYLKHLDLSSNRIESLQDVNFPLYLKSLNLSYNPIENIKGAKFPEKLEYLDISHIPNESMAGIRLPDLIVSLNLQRSMTNIRGLKFPYNVKDLNIAHNGVNSVNPLKLPNSIENLHLGYNNIKTLNKVQFPTSLKTLYVGNNLITTLKNVQFPYTLEVLDFDNDAFREEQDKCLTSLKDVVLPPNLRVLKLGYHAIKSVEGIEMPANLTWLSLAHNGLKSIRNVTFGNNLKVLDLRGNFELYNIDQLQIPESVVDLRIPAQLISYLPAYIIDRANKGQLTLSK